MGCPMGVLWGEGWQSPEATPELTLDAEIGNDVLTNTEDQGTLSYPFLLMLFPCTILGLGWNVPL